MLRVTRADGRAAQSAQFIVAQASCLCRGWSQAGSLCYSNSPVGLHLLYDSQGQAFRGVLLSDEAVLAEGRIKRAGVLKAAAFDEDPAGALVFPDEVHGD